MRHSEDSNEVDKIFERSVNLKPQRKGNRPVLKDCTNFNDLDLNNDYSEKLRFKLNNNSRMEKRIDYENKLKRRQEALREKETNSKNKKRINDEFKEKNFYLNRDYGNNERKNKRNDAGSYSQLIERPVKNKNLNKNRGSNRLRDKTDEEYPSKYNGLRLYSFENINESYDRSDNSSNNIHDPNSYSDNFSEQNIDRSPEESYYSSDYFDENDEPNQRNKYKRRNQNLNIKQKYSKHDHNHKSENVNSTGHFPKEKNHRLKPKIKNEYFEDKSSRNENKLKVNNEKLQKCIINKNDDRVRKYLNKGKNENQIKKNKHTDEDNNENIRDEDDRSLTKENSNFFSDLKSTNSKNKGINDMIYQRKLQNIRNDIDNLKNLQKLSIKDNSEVTKNVDLFSIQKEIEELRSSQLKIDKLKKESQILIEKEVSLAKEEFENEKKIEIQLINSKHDKELEEKECIIEGLKRKNIDTIEKYKKVCISKVKNERAEYEKQILEIKHSYEKKLSKYKEIYLKLKEKYKKDILKQYTKM